MNARPDAEQLAAQARYLLAGRLHGVLSTLSVDLPGFPFGSLVPYCLDQDGAPLFLLSHLAQHTKNLLSDAHAALTLSDVGEGGVARSARLTAMGEVVPVEDDWGAERYFRYFPESRDWFDHLGFRFFRLAPARWHFNAGFATARWFGNDRILRPALITARDEGALVDRVNRGAGAALAHELAGAGIREAASESVRLCGLDGEGMDIGVGDAFVRIPHRQPVESAESLRELAQAIAAG